MDPETLDALVDSHRELILVCQAMMSLILKYGLLDDLDGLLLLNNISPGFAARAEEAHDGATRERIISNVN